MEDHGTRGETVIPQDRDGVASSARSLGRVHDEPVLAAAPAWRTRRSADAGHRQGFLRDLASRVHA